MKIAGFMMRGHKTLIQEANLLAMSPEMVVTFLKKRAKQSTYSVFNDPVDEEAELALHSRASTRIDLALAQYARHIVTIETLFREAKPGSAIRLAALTNTTVHEGTFIFFPTRLFGDDEKTVAWIMEASIDELQALFENPTLSDNFLCSLLERSKPWGLISDEKFVIIVAALSRNERMRTPPKDDYIDGYAEYSYREVFNAAWKLAKLVEPSESWAMALSLLYDKLAADAFSIENPLLLMDRWEFELTNSEAAEKESEENKRGFLSNRQRIRKGLGRLALSKNSKLLSEMLSSGDVAIRCATYASENLTAEQLATAYQRDGELMFNEAIRNPLLWHTESTRLALREISRSVAKDKHSDMFAVNIYKSVYKEMLHKYPNWFKDKEDNPFDRSYHEKFIEQLKKSLQTLNSKISWIGLLLLGALIVNLFHF